MTRPPYRATLERVKEWSPTTRSLFLRLPPETAFAFTPGQFISLELRLGGDMPAVRAYSIASSPEQHDLLEICVDRVPGGAVSTHLFALERGATLDFKGPFGTFTVGDPPAAETVLVADGTAIAPIRAIVARILERGGTHPVTILHGARAESELLFRDELQSWMARHRRLRWEPVMAPAGLATGDNPPLERLVASRWVDADTDRTRHFWIAAVGDLVRRLRERLRAAGYDRRAIRYEQW